MSIVILWLIQATGGQLPSGGFSHFTQLGEFFCGKFGKLGIIFLGMIEASISISLVVFLLLFRFDLDSAIQHPTSAYVMLALAGIWSFAGPVLIWHYEAKSIPQFKKKFCGAVYGIRGNHDFDAMADVNAQTHGVANLVQMIWIMVCSFAFLLTSDSLIAGFGIAIFADWLWFYLFLIVIFFSYYTSIGIALALKTIYLSSFCAAALERTKFLEIDHEDAIDAMFFLSRRTTWPLASGVLFIPLMSVTPVVDSYSSIDITHALSALFTLALLITAFVPMKIFSHSMTRSIAKTRKSLLEESRHLHCSSSKGSVERLILNFQKIAYLKSIIRAPQTFWGIANTASIIWIPIGVNIFSSYVYKLSESFL